MEAPALASLKALVMPLEMAWAKPPVRAVAEAVGMALVERVAEASVVAPAEASPKASPEASPGASLEPLGEPRPDRSLIPD
jgi:hypothetical protein